MIMVVGQNLKRAVGLQAWKASFLFFLEEVKGQLEGVWRGVITLCLITSG